MDDTLKTPGDPGDKTVDRALKQGLITPEQLAEARSEQAREVAGGRAAPRSLVNILLTLGYLTPEQVSSLHEKEPVNPRRSGD